MSFKVPEKYRITKNHRLASDSSYGNNGVFIIPFQSYKLHCIASDGLEWEHVSVSYSKDKVPNWGMMCFVKNIFWDLEDCVMQLHPQESKYVNIHNGVLHLWRPVKHKIPTPPLFMV